MIPKKNSYNHSTSYFNAAVPNLSGSVAIAERERRWFSTHARCMRGPIPNRLCPSIGLQTRGWGLLLSWISFEQGHSKFWGLIWWHHLLLQSRKGNTIVSTDWFSFWDFQLWLPCEYWWWKHWNIEIDLCATGERGTVVIVSYLHLCSICSTSHVGNIIQSVRKE